MKALLRAEIYKLYKQRRTYYALGAIVGMELVILVSAYYQGRAFIDFLLVSLRQSFYLQGELLNGNLLVYVILNSLWFHLPLLLMIIVSSLLTSEYKDGTLMAVFLQPVNKYRFITCKYLVAMAFTVLAVLFLAITAFALSYTLFGKGDLIVYLDSLNFYAGSDATLRLLMAFASGAVTMNFYSVVSLTLAIVFRDTTITWILAAFFLIVSNLLLRIDFGESWVGQLLYAKLGESWQYLFVNEINWPLIVQNNLLLLLYTVLVMGLGILIFKRSDIG